MDSNIEKDPLTTVLTDILSKFGRLMFEDGVQRSIVRTLMCQTPLAELHLICRFRVHTPEATRWTYKRRSCRN